MWVGRKKARDANGTQILTSTGRATYESQQILGNLLPDFTGGMFTTLNYKNWDLGLGFDFQKGGTFYSTTNMFTYYSGIHEDTVGLNAKGNPMRDPVSAGGGVNVVGVTSSGEPVDTYLSASFYHYQHFFGNHENWLYDASYVKLRTARLGLSLIHISEPTRPY